MKAFRRFLETTLLALCALLLIRALGTEPYGVPTGSMAPTLLGHHKAVVCPRCGYPVRVGAGGDPADAHAVHAAGAACPNCGSPDLGLDRAPVCRGDHLLVNKSVYDWRTPRRWEMAIFTSPVDDTKVFVKRVVGLPGESVEVRAGDVYIDHELARKTLTELKALRVPVFDNNYQPADGWAARWLAQPDRDPVPQGGPRLRLETEGAADYQWLVYRHTFAATDKARPVFDEYAYNGSDPTRPPEPVHDFMIECDLEVRTGNGWLAVGLDDGGNEILAEFPVGSLRDGTHLSERPADGSGGEPTVYRTAPTFGLTPGKTYHVEFAFADRRASLAVDGRQLFAPLDRPAVARRADVVRPARIGARGVELGVHNFRLFRDVHYTSAGRHAVQAPVRLGAGQYFVLGDNSPNSDDSRFWSDGAGRPLPVAEASFLGKPFLLHMPSRMQEGVGGRPELRVDWGRVRWLH
jgi:signal peptidase I